MMVPDEAIEAAAKELHAHHWGDDMSNRPEATKELYQDRALATLEAAAPYLRAQALEDAAEDMTERVSAIEQMVVEEWMYDALCAMREQAIQDLAWLRERAAAERGPDV